MKIRQATIGDIAELFSVRMSVKENILNNTALVTDEICAEYLTCRGRGWVCEINEKIAGFAIADLAGNSIWALFVRPEQEGKGIGKLLHNEMLNWYFSQTDITVWLTTAPGTRAEQFYEKTGWQNIGLEKGEVRFEMTQAKWSAKEH